MADPAVVIDELVKRYGPRVAVDHLSLTVERASITAVLGPNGAGKTTTIECCEGYRKWNEGAIRVLGLDPIRQAADLRSRIGVMLQNGGLYPGVRTREILSHVAGLYAHPIDVDYLIERVGLTSAVRTQARRLSGGERQRLLFAMAIVGRPELVFLDEPSSGLDPSGRRMMWELVSELRRDGVTIVLTTHLMEEAERLADKVAVMSRGRMVAYGSPQELTATGNVLRFNARPGLALDSLRSRLGQGVGVSESPPGTYLVEGALGPDEVAAVTAWCAGQGVMPEGLAMGKKTLEDVFLELTEA
jgi:ABC-2 type transport system ATP-binding protein